jgi:hypothetical protein
MSDDDYVDESTHPEADDTDFEESEDTSESSVRGRIESLLPKLVKKAIAQGVDVLNDEKLRETVVADAVRKAISGGSKVVDTTEDSVRKLLGELSLPKELADRILGKFDDYKADVLGLVKEEIHEFLGRIDLGNELQKALTSLSLEISTEIRFIPNEKGVTGRNSVKPQVKTSTRVKRRRTKASADEESEE